MARNHRYPFDSYDGFGKSYADRHIREANRFSEEMGGIDQDVKQYFFNLPQSRLSELFERYRQIHGNSAATYAQNTFKCWKSGRKRMSGQVAERLFNLLPTMMPLPDKQKLIESICSLRAGSSYKLIYVGLDETAEEVKSKIESHFNEHIKPNYVPRDLEMRFNWLSQGDVRIHQDLNNYYASLNKNIMVSALNNRLPIILEEMQKSPGTSVTQVVEVGKHRLEIKFGNYNKKPNSSSDNQKSNLSDFYGCLLVGAIVLILIVVAKK